MYGVSSRKFHLRHLHLTTHTIGKISYSLELVLFVIIIGAVCIEVTQ